jgi:hypothetical protein
MNDMFTQLKNVCAILLAITLVSACGGSSGGGGVSPPPPPPPPPPTGGITRTGVAIAVGPITGFGSVIVNGVRYDTSSATFTKDGVDSSQAEMSVGEFVVVTGTIDDDNTNAVATTVEFEDLVEGPIGEITGSGFVALGQTVVLGGASIDDSCPNPLAVGVNVEVSGTFFENGDIDASRVECKALLLEMEVKGNVSGLTATTFQINALTVDFSGITPRDFPGGAITDGDPVEVKGTSLDAGPPLTLTATDVEFKGARFGDNEGDHVEVEGFVANFVSATEFTVSTIPVTTDDNTIYEPAGMSASDIGPNLKVEVEGDFDATGALLATKFEFKQATSVRVAGLVDSDDPDKPLSRFVLGIEITSDPNLTRIEDKTDAKIDPLTIVDIVAGNYIEVRGQEFPAGTGILAATLLERDDGTAADTELRGFVEVGGKNEPDLTVLSVTISTNGATAYRDDRLGTNLPMLAVDFWAAVAEGSPVEAKGTEVSDRAMLADEIELED